MGCGVVSRVEGMRKEREPVGGIKGGKGERARARVCTLPTYRGPSPRQKSMAARAASRQATEGSAPQARACHPHATSRSPSCGVVGCDLVSMWMDGSDSDGQRDDGAGRVGLVW